MKHDTWTLLSTFNKYYISFECNLINKIYIEICTICFKIRGKVCPSKFFPKSIYREVYRKINKIIRFSDRYDNKLVSYGPLDGVQRGESKRASRVIWFQFATLRCYAIIPIKQIDTGMPHCARAAHALEINAICDERLINSFWKWKCCSTYLRVRVLLSWNGLIRTLRIL